MKKKFAVWVYIIGFLSCWYLLFKSEIPGKIFMHNENIYTNGVVYEKVWNAYDKLPENVKELVKEEKYKIYVVDELKSNNAEYITLGRTYSAFRIIKISNINLRVERTTLHEYGHVIDDKLAIRFVSESKEFKDIYLNEKENFAVDDNHEYFTSSELEYFASAFAEYILDPERLKENTPRTYEFMENCINNLN